MRIAGQLMTWWQRRRPPGGERRALLRYHGVWGPGVRLLQNLTFRNKALVLVVCLIVPMGHLMFQDWQRNRLALESSRHALSGLAPYQMAVAEQVALDDLGTAMFNDELALASDISVDKAARAEVRANAELTDALSAYPDLSPDARQAMRNAGVLRQDALRLLHDNSGATTGGTSSRLDALRQAVRATEELRLSVLRSMGVAMHEDEAITSLVNGGLETLSPVQRELRLIRGIGTRLLRGGAAGAGQGPRLAEEVGALQHLLDDASRDLRPAIAQGLVDPARARRALDEMATFVRSARRMAMASTGGTRAEDVVGAVGFGPADFRARASAAEAAARTLHEAVLHATTQLLVSRNARHHRDILLALVVIGLGVGSMAYLLVCLTKVVGGGLAELCSRVDALARGDLTERPQARGTDEVGQAMTALGASVRRMASLFEAVTQGVAAVSHASREVAVGNAGLSGRTVDIRRSIGDVSERARSSMAAMNRCGDEVERISEHMRDVRADAHRSRKAMGELQERMRGLQSKSREIGRVVLLVESVAHQTRLLSLNASVEAARAGPSGKGFAVVAQEVRDLARRSEAAARKIGEIVQSSVDDIEAGGVLTERVGDSVRLTDERVAEVSAIMADIVRLTHTGRDQSQEVVGITRSVEESAGGNARMVEQLAHASADLRTQGDNLKRSMQHFVFG